MSLIFPVNHILPLLTADQTHRNLAQNKNSCYFFITRFYVVHLCCSPQYNRQRLQVFSYPFHKKQYFHIILYFINISYSSLAFDQL